MATDTRRVMRPGEGKTVSMPGHQVTFIQREQGAAYSLIEWVAAPDLPGPPLHLHRRTDEAFYVVEGTFGFQAGDDTVEGGTGAYVFIPKGLAHTFWNQGRTPAKLLVLMSPPGFEQYFEALAEGLASAGDSPAAAMDVRQALAAQHDIEVVGPPRHARG